MKEESENFGLKLNIQKTKIVASGPITSWEIDGETVETVSVLFFWAPKSLQMVIAAMKLKDAYSLEGKLWPTSVQFSSVAQSCPALCDPVSCSTPGLPVHQRLPEFTQTHIHQVSDAIQPSHPLSSPSSPAPIPPSIRVFSNESTLRMRWPKYWSFSFSIIPSKEIPGLISFRMDWLDLLVVQDQPKQHIKKQRHYFFNKGPSGQGCGFSSSHVWMWELDHKESWAPKNWCFWTVVLEKTLESPLDCKEIQPVHPKGDQSWVFIGRTDAETETLKLWPPYAKSWLIWKDLDAEKDWGQEEKGMTEDEMAGW